VPGFQAQILMAMCQYFNLSAGCCKTMCQKFSQRPNRLNSGPATRQNAYLYASGAEIWKKAEQDPQGA
jgi:hypothetical protein